MSKVARAKGPVGSGRAVPWETGPVASTMMRAGIDVPVSVTRTGPREGGRVGDVCAELAAPVLAAEKTAAATESRLSGRGDAKLGSDVVPLLSREGGRHGAAAGSADDSACAPEAGVGAGLASPVGSHPGMWEQAVVDAVVTERWPAVIDSAAVAARSVALPALGTSGGGPASVTTYRSATPPVSAFWIGTCKSGGAAGATSDGCAVVALDPPTMHGVAGDGGGAVQPLSLPGPPLPGFGVTCSESVPLPATDSSGRGVTVAAWASPPRGASSTAGALATASGGQTAEAAVASRVVARGRL